MSDQPTSPPKPKPGSLRDRIAAFEKPAAAAAQGPAPPRPKPGGLSWKPKVSTPPSSPSNVDQAALSERKVGGMSASDAKESIGKGGSLKERMAALQNKGGFGAPPPVAPKPALEKPKWKPPPVIAPVEDDEDETPRGETSKSPSVPSVKLADDEPARDNLKEEESPAVEDGEQAEPDAEEEERQRRAAIAARMARLGGARVGMAPVFGSKPSAKKLETKEEHALSDTLKDEDVKSTESKPAVDDVPIVSPLVEAAQENQLSDTTTSLEHQPQSQRKSSESASLLSLDSERQAQPTNSPGSVPLPPVPRRAGPPRKKSAKSPVPPTAIVDEELTESPDVIPPAALSISSNEASTITSIEKKEGGDREEEIGEIDKDEIEPATSERPPVTTHVDAIGVDTAIHEERSAVDDQAQPHEDEEDKEAFVENKERVAETTHVKSTDIGPPPHIADVSIDEDEDDRGSINENSEVLQQSHEVSPPKSPVVSDDTDPKENISHVTKDPVEAEDQPEDEEIARRKRLSEKLAKMGGINPFAPPPQRKASVSSTDGQISPTVPVSPPFQKRTSISKENPTSPIRKDSLRKSSIDSTLVAEETTPQPPSQEFVADTVSGSLSEGKQDDSHVGQGVGNVSSKGIPEEAEESSDVDELSGEGDLNREESKPDRDSLTLHATEVNTFGGVEDDDSEVPPPVVPAPPVPHLSTRPVISKEAPVDPALLIEPIPLPIQSLPQVPLHIASPPARSLPPPPPRLVPQPNDTDDTSESELAVVSEKRISTPPLSQQSTDDEDVDDLPPRPLPPRRINDDDEYDNTDSETLPLPVPNRRSTQGQDGYNTGPTITHMSSSRPFRSIPPPPPLSAPASDVEQDSDYEALPTRPRHRPLTPGTPPSNEVPLIVPPPTSDDPTRKPDPSPLRQSTYPSHSSEKRDFAPTSPEEQSSSHLTPTLSVSDQEILDEEEGDPIDPAFHSPSRPDSTINLPSVSPPSHSPPSHSQEPSVEHHEDSEQVSRRTIAERMAKLGGIKFGAAPIPASISRPPPPPPRNEDEISPESPHHSEIDHVEPSEEEEERARKERISAKLAGMGGMRIGMLPLGVGGLRPQQSRALQEESAPTSEPVSAPAPTTLTPPPPPPPARAAQPSRPPPPHQSHDSDADLSASQHSFSTSEDGVKVEAEESEIEEVSHEDVEELEEAPPPVPSRVARRGTSESESIHAPIVPATRPPIPESAPSRKSSVQTATSATRKSSIGSTFSLRRSSTHKHQPEYVMVEEPVAVDEPPPPPPPRPASRAPPTRGPLPPAPTEPTESISSHWELPSIPSSSLEFGGDTDLSASWTDDVVPEPSPSSPPPPPPPAKKAVTPAAPVDRHLSPDDLIAVWGRVGVQICEVATSLFDKSKKALVGDGTYGGFVEAVLSEVPNAATPSPPSYGYVVYIQTGNSVQKRASEIMPGDVVELQDAKLKGHKGIHTYNQSVGVGEPLVGIVSEFEPKKSKIRVFQANQHVGQQTVEAVSYRLEDLKSGTVKVYRILEA